VGALQFTKRMSGGSSCVCGLTGSEVWFQTTAIFALI